MTEVKLQTGHSVHRCPFCHDDVRSEEAVACRDCLARHHPGCWDEGMGCSSCSCAVRLEPRGASRPELTPKRATDLLLEAGYSAAEVRELLRSRAPSRVPTLLRLLGPPLALGALIPLLGLVYYGLGGRGIAQWADLFLFGLMLGVIYSVVAELLRHRRA